MAATPELEPSMPEPEFRFDPGELTLGDLIDLEDHFGISLQQLMSQVDSAQLEQLGAKLLAAFAFIVLRQRDSAATPVQAKATKLTELIAMAGGQRRVQAVARAQRRLAQGPKGARQEDPQVGG